MDLFDVSAEALVFPTGADLLTTVSDLLTTVSEFVFLLVLVLG